MSELQGECKDELQSLDYEVHMSTDVLPNNQDGSTVDTSINMDLYRDTNADNQDMDIMEASSDDFQAELIHQEGDESDIPNQSYAKVAPIIEPIKTLA